MNNIKYNVVLARLGVTVWKLRYIIVVDNQTSEQFWIYPRFLLISSSNLSLEDPFVQDIIQIMSFDITDVYLLITKKIKNLIIPKNFFCHCWWLGVDVVYDFRGICFKTPSLSVLKSDMEIKKKFWLHIRHVVYGC